MTCVAPPCHFCVSAEDKAGWHSAAVVGTAVLMDTVDWLAAQEEESVLASFHWDADRTHITLKAADNEFQALGKKGLRLHGRVDGKACGGDVSGMRAAFCLALDREAKPDAVIVCRDTDKNRSPVVDFKRAVELTPQLRLSPRVIPILAEAHPEAEAWVLAGFEPAHPDEARALDGLCKEASFDPSRNPERTTSAPPDDAARSAKGACTRLVGNDLGRRERCLKNVQRLEQHGQKCGVASYIQAVRNELAPALGAQPQSRQPRSMKHPQPA